MKTVRVSCSCTNDFQDKRYGKKRRVANVATDGEKAACTVCGTIHNIKRIDAYGEK